MNDKEPTAEARRMLQEHCYECPEMGAGAFISSGDALEQAIATALAAKDAEILRLRHVVNDQTCMHHNDAERLAAAADPKVHCPCCRHALRTERDALDAEILALKYELRTDKATEVINSLRAERDNLKAENVTFRAAQKACEDCDAPTMQEVANLKAEVERLGELEDQAADAVTDRDAAIAKAGALNALLVEALTACKALMEAFPCCDLSSYEREQVNAATKQATELLSRPDVVEAVKEGKR